MRGKRKSERGHREEKKKMNRGVTQVCVCRYLLRGFSQKFTAGLQEPPRALSLHLWM